MTDIDLDAIRARWAARRTDRIGPSDADDDVATLLTELDRLTEENAELEGLNSYVADAGDRNFAETLKDLKAMRAELDACRAENERFLSRIMELEP